MTACPHRGLAKVCPPRWQSLLVEVQPTVVQQCKTSLPKPDNLCSPNTAHNIALLCPRCHALTTSGTNCYRRFEHIWTQGMPWVPFLGRLPSQCHFGRLVVLVEPVGLGLACDKLHWWLSNGGPAGLIRFQCSTDGCLRATLGIQTAQQAKIPKRVVIYTHMRNTWAMKCTLKVAALKDLFR